MANEDQGFEFFHDNPIELIRHRPGTSLSVWGLPLRLKSGLILHAMPQQQGSVYLLHVEITSIHDGFFRGEVLEWFNPDVGESESIVRVGMPLDFTLQHVHSIRPDVGFG